MMRRSVAKLGGGHHSHGLPLDEMYLHGIPKRTFPYYEFPISPALTWGAPGAFVTKSNLSIPLYTGRLHWYNWQPLTAMLLVVMCIDMAVGIPHPWLKDRVPGRAMHNFFNNNNGTPHHWWQYQDGWTLPNPSGVKRWMD